MLPVHLKSTTLTADVVDTALAAGLLMLVGLQATVQPEAEPSALYLAFSALVTLPLAWHRR